MRHKTIDLRVTPTACLVFIDIPEVQNQPLLESIRNELTRFGASKATTHTYVVQLSDLVTIQAISDAIGPLLRTNGAVWIVSSSERGPRYRILMEHKTNVDDTALIVDKDDDSA